MKRLISTTAIATCLALPIAAQQATQSGTQTGQVQTQAGTAQSAQLEIQASDLIGKRLYIEREATDQAGVTEQQRQQDQQTQQAQTDEPQGTQQTTMGMAQFEEGVSQVPETWTMAGEISDVLLTQEGQVQALVVDAGGFLGMNESTRRIDIQDVRFVPHTEREDEFFAVYAGARQDFEGSEAFDEASLGEGTLRGREMWGEEIEGRQADVAFTSITTDEIVGTAVYGSNDNWVGEISDLALTADGEIEAVVVDVGGFLGIGQKPVALSMEQIQFRRGEGGLFRDDLRAYVDATEEELESLEEWEEDAG
jgi:hypothetical protein